MLCPARGLTEHPVADAVDEAGIFSDGYECIGADQTVPGVSPPYECLRFADTGGLRVQDGLEMDFELPRSDRFAQILGDSQASLGRILEGLGEITVAVLAFVFCLVHGLVGQFQQRVYVCGVRWVQGDADTSGNVDELIPEVKLISQAVDNLSACESNFAMLKASSI